MISLRKYGLILPILGCIFLFFVQAKAPNKERHKAFYENGVLREKGWFKEGQKHGIWWSFYETGVRKTKEKFKKGQRIYLFEYNEKGLIFRITNKTGISKDMNSCGC